MTLDSLIEYLRIIIDNSTIKYAKLAKETETVNSARDFDLYLNAYNKTDTFELYNVIYYTALVNAGVEPTEDYTLYDLIEDKSKIPINKRNAVVEAQRNIILNSYIENNNYYRMFLGLPDIEEFETNYITLDYDIETEYNIEHGTYIHELNSSKLRLLKVNGIIDTLIENNPTKKYLKYLGNSIDIIRAREANNFALLQIDTTNIPEEFYTFFMSVYEQCREYFSVTIYNKEFSNRYKYYDNFIGLCIMIMTIQRVVSHTFRLGIKRDLYDWSFIQAMYRMYNVPFMEHLSMQYHIIILKNLNNLLRYKSTDKVLFDVCSLLGYSRMNILKYFLVKRQKMDDNNNPIFLYDMNKPIYDDSPEPEIIGYELDYPNMYDIYFQGVDLEEENVTLALLDKTNEHDYNEVIESDPYWWVDDDLNSVLYESEYNYIESKYLELNLMYNMTDIMFEITYFFRMILDRKNDLDNFTIDLHKLYNNKQFKIFDVIIFLACLVCKKNGFESNIVYGPSDITYFKGFNFDQEDINVIKTIINENRKYFDEDDFNNFLFLDNMEIADYNAINNLFIKIKDLKDFIIEKMSNSDDIKEYHIYKKIFTILYTTESQNSMYTIYDDNNDPIRATTYEEYLEYHEPILHDILQYTEVHDIPDTIDHVVASIRDEINDLEHLHIINDNSAVFNAILTLISFLKSYTVDISAFNIIYLFDSKYYNMIKLITDVKLISDIKIDESLNTEYFDDVKIHSYIEKIKDLYNFNDELSSYIHFSFDDDKYIEESLKLADSNISIKDSVIKTYSDIIKFDKDNKYNDKLKVSDKLKLKIIYD